MRYLLVAICLLGCGLSQADELVIHAPALIKAETYHRYQAFLLKDNGERVDVTKDARFSSLARINERAAGEILFRLPYSINQMWKQMTLKASYVTPEGETLGTQRTFAVSMMPDYLRITGPYRVGFGGFASFRVYGYYGAKSIDLTSKGQWWARYGRISSWRSYRAPRSSIGLTRDEVVFRIASKQKRHSINLY